MKLLLCVVASALAMGALGDSMKRYDNFKVVKVTAHTISQLQLLQSLERQTVYKVDYFKKPERIGRPIKVMVGPKDYGSFFRTLRAADMHPELMNFNFQKVLDREQIAMAGQEVFRAGQDPKEFALDKYHGYQEIMDWLDMLVKQYPDVATLDSVGKSKEGRDIKLIKIGHNFSESKKGFWIDAGIHAREWIAPSTAVWIINELLTNHNGTYKDLLDAVDFYIMPSMNPDGYEYTRSHDRLWRKTRGGPYCKKGIFGKKCCYGADPNRNWDFKWAVSGASDDPCSEVYEGPTAFSEVECKQTSVYQLAIAKKLEAMITLHSYSEDILYPYGYGTGVYPPDVKELKELGDKMGAACKKVHGTEYAVVNSGDGLYPASGASDDWAKHNGIKWVYTIELRPGPGDKDNDEQYGFELPDTFIIRTADEIWPAILVAADRVMTGPN